MKAPRTPPALEEATMQFATIMKSIRRSVEQFPRQYAEGRARQLALVPFAAAPHVVSFLGKLSTNHDERARVLAAVLEEHRDGRKQVWQAILVTSFAPLLFVVRQAFEDPEDDDLNQIVLLAFLEAISVDKLDLRLPAIAIEGAMYNALTRLCRGDMSS